MEEEEEVGKKLCSFVLASHPWQSPSPQMGGTKQKEEMENVPKQLDGHARGCSVAALTLIKTGYPNCAYRIRSKTIS